MWWGSLAALKDEREVMDIGTTIVLIFMLMSHLTLSFQMYSSHLDHHIRTKLYQLPVTKLRSLQKEVVDTKNIPSKFSWI